MKCRFLLTLLFVVAVTEKPVKGADATRTKGASLPHRVEIPGHPWPARLREVNEAPISRKDAAFDALSLAEKLEFATFYLLEYEPPDVHWIFKLWKLKDPGTARTLRDMILAEKSDHFAEALMGCAKYMAKGATQADYELLKKAGVARLRSIKNHEFRLAAAEDLEQMERMYEETKGDGG